MQQPLEILAPPSPRLPLSQSLPLPSILPQPLIFLPPRPRLLLAHSKLTTANVVDKDIAVPPLASLHTPASTLTNITPSACNLRIVPRRSLTCMYRNIHMKLMYMCDQRRCISCKDLDNQRGNTELVLLLTSCGSEESITLRCRVQVNVLA